MERSIGGCKKESWMTHCYSPTSHPNVCLFLSRPSSQNWAATRTRMQTSRRSTRRRTRTMMARVFRRRTTFVVIAGHTRALRQLEFIRSQENIKRKRTDAPAAIVHCSPTSTCRTSSTGSFVDASLVRRPSIHPSSDPSELEPSSPRIRRRDIVECRRGSSIVEIKWKRREGEQAPKISWTASARTNRFT